ncbi:hypothetical protein KP509_29G023500 [Ceratopteris richardii]|uniref:Uncharacterized protein n=1 Tax=Ceratopteris richardii TaxID=49495 RepID=A0A8T2R7Q2_CERRI|nr:hypothetical protein KP509_29G023500 [Ceratopteris richardii]
MRVAMELIPSIHIFVSCSFVLLLAYVLFIILSYLASLLLHPSPSKSRRRGSFGASHRRSIVGQSRFSAELERADRQDVQDALVTDRMQEHGEEEDEEDDYTDADAQMGTFVGQQASAYALNDGIFGDIITEDLGSEEYFKHADEEVCAGEERGRLNSTSEEEHHHADEEDNLQVVSKSQAEDLEEKAYAAGRRRNSESSENDGALMSDQQKREQHLTADATENGDSTVDHFDDGDKRNSYQGITNGTDNGNLGSTSKLGDPQGSTSLQQRLPPTWSDLERLVNINSKKIYDPPTISQVDE